MLLSVAVLVPLFLTAVLPDSFRSLVCRYTGVVMPEESCCPEQDNQTPDNHAQLRDESCCVVKTVQLVKLVSDRQSEAAAAAPQALCAGVGARELYVAVVVPKVWNDSAPHLGPPLVLVKHAFLI